MPVSINGQTGVITGLAAGGLPDGIVQTADLADDAVTIAKLSATGTASSSTFLRGDGAFAAAGGGKVLKHQHNEFTNTVGVSGSYPQNIFSWSFTPTSTSSTIFLWFTSNILLYGSNAYKYGKYGLWHDTTTELINSYNTFNMGTGENGTVTGVMFAKHASHNTTSAITYRIRAGYFYSATNMNFNDEQSLVSPHCAAITMEMAA